MRRTLALLVCLLGASAPPARAEPPSPASVLGFAPGEDRKLADWGQITTYFERLAAASPRVRLDRVGATTEGRPFLAVTITSEANQARLDAIRRANLRLADPRGLSEDEARALVAKGKAIVAMTFAIHSTEVGSFLTPLVLAHRLATGGDPDIGSVLENVVLVLVPSLNPDGVDLVTDWYRRFLGTPFEGTEPPLLYHPYTGHDLNRDWYMFTQAETRMAAALLDRWRPQILNDVHQMKRTGARIFVPPYLDPHEPNIDPALVSATAAIGAHVASRLTAQGRKGVLIHGLFDAFTPARTWAFTHGAVRVLSETASARLASPVRTAFEELERGAGYDPRAASWNFPDPWPGGEWTLRDIVDYQLAAALALLEHAAGNRAFWLRLFLDVNRRAVSRTDPYAFVVPLAQRDPLAAAKLLEVLGRGAVEIHRARSSFEAEGRRYPAGSHVVLLQQPASGLAKTVLERQRYPDVRLHPDGPPVTPYDVTAHTLPLLLGVEVSTLSAPFPADLEPARGGFLAAGSVSGAGRLLALGHGSGELVAAGRLLRTGVPVRWALQEFQEKGATFPAGTLLVPASARATLEAWAAELGLRAQAVDAEPARALRLRAPRVGLYRSWVPSMDEGWTRFVFERQIDVRFDTLRDGEVRAGGLAQRFDVIVLPDQRADLIRDGHGAGTLPPEYTGGLGPPGVAALRSFLEGGGTLVALNDASEFAIRELALPVRNALADKGAGYVFCPGAILEARVDAASPLAHGLPAVTPLWFQSSPAFETKEGRVVLRYGDGPLLLSGWLVGGERLAGKGALVEVRRGQGRVVLFGFRPQYRAQSWATYVALLNAIYTSAAVEEDLSADGPGAAPGARAPARSGSPRPSGRGR